jgi:glutaredoxin
MLGTLVSFLTLGSSMPRNPSQLLGAASAVVTPLLSPIYRLQAPAQARVLGLLKGGYDGAAARAAVQETVASAPVVIYSYPLSPFCIEAIAVLRGAGVSEPDLKVVEPGAEWFLLGPDGSATRAALAELYGQTSFPFIFIGGESIGGLFSGTPGLKALVDDGSLEQRIAAARGR